MTLTVLCCACRSDVRDCTCPPRFAWKDGVRTEQSACTCADVLKNIEATLARVCDKLEIRTSHES